MKNGVLMQYFEWNMPNNGRLWRELAEDAPHLAEIGVTAVWIPPAYKADEQADEGYATYDLWDFGEFDQKGTVRTKYGTCAALRKAIKALHDNGIQVILDTVLNHKAGGDRPERFMAVPVDGENRNDETGEPREIEAYTSFEFPGRKDKYSAFKWHWYHFSGVDCDTSTGDCGVYRILGEGKGWSQGVDSENGNYDYLLANDIDLDNPEVTEELFKWGKWAVKRFGFDGFRMDAVKHMDYNFTREFLKQVRSEAGDRFYAVSEYWIDDLDTLREYLDHVEGSTDLFDVPLHYNLHRAGEEGADFDMSTLLDGSLAMEDGTHALTFVDNHDSQPGSSLESTVSDRFKPMAYALILLMQRGYPAIFYGDYYSIGGEASVHRSIIDTLLEARRKYAYGDEELLFDHPTTVGLIRHGDAEHPGSGVVLLMSNDEDGTKDVCLGDSHAGETWRDITGSCTEPVTVGDGGNATFCVKGSNIAVWVKAE